MKKYALFLLSLLMLLTTTTIPVAANSYLSEIDDDLIFYIDENTTEDEKEELINEFLNTPDATLVFLDESLLEEDLIDKNEHIQEEVDSRVLAQFRVIRGATHARRANTNVTLISANGTPGMNVSISATRGASNSVTGTFGATNGIISSEVGFNVTHNHSLMIQGSKTVPATHNGRRVRSMTLRAHPYIQPTNFHVDRRATPVSSWVRQGTGTANRVLGVAFRHSFTLQ